MQATTTCSASSMRSQNIMKRHPRPLFVGCVLAVLAGAAPADAQSGLSDALLALDNAPPSSIRSVNGRLFSGVIDARIVDRNSNFADFGDDDEVEFTISGGGATLRFDEDVRTRREFERWARENAADLLAIIFPGSLSSATLGHDAGQLYAQQLLLSTALSVEPVREPGAPRRLSSGGLVEFEWFAGNNSRPHDSGSAWQGLYAIGQFGSVQARYARQRADLSTNAWAVAFDYHPYREIDGPVIVRIGATARTGFLYSHAKSLGRSSQALDLGTIDYGGGGWTSVRKNFRRVRVGGGGLFQGTKSFVPIIDDGDLDFLAGVINGRGVSWDLAYGGTVAVDTSTSTAVIGKYVESRSVKEEFDRPALHMVLIGYSFTMGPGTALDAGYKFSSSGRTRSGGVFLEGNFGW
jgi:hypothetical protein